MAIRKDQALTVGQFFPSSDKNVIYHCYLNNTAGFLRDFIIFSVLIGFFAFLIMQFLGLIVLIFSWVIIIPWLVPKHYKFIQINKYVLAFGTGSFLVLLRSYFKEIYEIKRLKYNDIYHLRFDRWYSKKRRGKIDSFGRVEIKINDTEQFHILIHSSDLARLVKTLETHRFQSKVHKSRSHDELLLIFPSSPNFSESGG